MTTTWRDRLRDLMLRRGMNMKELSVAAGLGLTAIKDMLERGSVPSVERLDKVAVALGVTLSELYEGDESGAQTVSVLGIASAGEGWTAPPDDSQSGFEPITMKVEEGEPVAIVVRGDSMMPRYMDGDLLIGARRVGRAADNLIGLSCIVETEDGRRFIKFIHRGVVRGTYDLRSVNPAVDDIRGVRLAWAAPVQWIKCGRR